MYDFPHSEKILLAREVGKEKSTPGVMISSLVRSTKQCRRLCTVFKARFIKIQAWDAWDVHRMGGPWAVF